MPTRGGARAGRTSRRRKHAGLREDGNTPTNASCGLVTALTSSSGKGSCSRTWIPPGTIQCPRRPPDRKHERPITPDVARPPRHALDPTHESCVLVVLHPLSAPATSSDDPSHHAHRRSPRKCLVSSELNPPSHRHHPRLGPCNLLQRTPPHHPPAATPGTNPQPTSFVL